MKGAEINCEKILLKDLEKSSNSKMEVNTEKSQTRVNSEESEEGSEIEIEFDKLVNKVETEMGNLNNLKSDLMRFKQTRLRKVY